MYSRHMSSKTRDWIIALGTVALIYATLEVARFPLAFLRSHGWLRISLGIIFTLSSVGIFTLLIRNHGISLWRFALTLAIGGIYFYSAQTVQTPEEQIHFLEYGLVGIFFSRAAAHHVKNPAGRAAAALTLACLAGWIDELLQGLLPNRHYDIHDVGLNAVSAALGLLITLILRPKNSPR